MIYKGVIFRRIREIAECTIIRRRSTRRIDDKKDTSSSVLYFVYPT